MTIYSCDIILLAMVNAIDSFSNNTDTNSSEFVKITVPQHWSPDILIPRDALPPLDSLIQSFLGKDLKIIVYPRSNPNLSTETHVISGLKTMRWDEGPYFRKLIVVGKDGESQEIPIPKTATNLKFCHSTPEPPKQTGTDGSRLSREEIHRQFQEGLVTQIHTPAQVDLPCNQESELRFYCKQPKCSPHLVNTINKDLEQYGFTEGEVEICYKDRELYKGSLRSSRPLSCNEKNEVHVFNQDNQPTLLALPKKDFIRITKVAEVIDDKVC